jgi:hypothetical protein
VEEFFVYEEGGLIIKDSRVVTEVPADLADTVDLIDSDEDHHGPVTIVRFTRAGAAHFGAEEVRLRFGSQSYCWDLVHYGVERGGLFYPDSPAEGASGVAWATENPAVAALDAVGWAERILEDELEVA